MTEELNNEDFVAANSKNFNGKQPYTDLNVDIKRLQSKYNNKNKLEKYIRQAKVWLGMCGTKMFPFCPRNP